MRSEWTVQFDDLLTKRWQRCIFCLEPADRVELRYLDSERSGGYAMALGLCAKCVRLDPDEQRRLALVKQRAQWG